jgi:hypothetical protein
MSLWDFDSIKGVLGLTKSVESYAGFETLADSAEARIEAYLQRHLPLTTYTDRGRLYRRTAPYIPLRGLPIASVSTLTIDGVPVSADEYEIDEYGLFLYAERTGLWVCTYSGGLEEAPAWLSRALTMQIAYEWQGHDHIGASNVSTSGGSVSRPALELLPDVRAVLAPYRHARHCFN